MPNSISKTTYPAVSIGRRDHARLKELARAARADRHPVADFLLAEIRRAHVFEQGFEQGAPDTVVALDCRVTYRVDFGPVVTRRLAHPEDYQGEDKDVSILSSLGAALIGLRGGDRMPYRDVLGTLHFVKVLHAGPPPPNSIRSSAGPFDPGPQAA